MYRGTFAFHAMHEPALLQLFNSGDEVEYRGPVDGACARLRVRLTDIDLEDGLASFQGVGEPY